VAHNDFIDSLYYESNVVDQGEAVRRLPPYDRDFSVTHPLKNVPSYFLLCVSQIRTHLNENS